MDASNGRVSFYIMDLSKVPNIEFSASLLSVAYECLSPEEFGMCVISVVDKIRDETHNPTNLSKQAYRCFLELYDIAETRAKKWYNSHKGFIEDNPQKKKVDPCDQ